MTGCWRKGGGEEVSVLALSGAIDGTSFTLHWLNCREREREVKEEWDGWRWGIEKINSSKGVIEGWMGDKRIDPELVAGSLCVCCPVIFFLHFFFFLHLTSHTPSLLLPPLFVSHVSSHYFHPSSAVSVAHSLPLMFVLWAALLANLLHANRLAVLASVHTAVKTLMSIFMRLP